MLDSVLVEDPVELVFGGAIARTHATAIWTWLRRDVAASLLDSSLSDADPAAATALEQVVPQLLVQIHTFLSQSMAQPDGERRIKAQIGGDEAWSRLPLVLSALKNRVLLDRARAFGRATNALPDDAALAAALQSLPNTDAIATALLMQAVIGQVTTPSRLVNAAIRITGDAKEAPLRRAGFAPMVDALLAHAQNQLHTLAPMGAFADIDLTCRTVDRFHKLVRAVHSFIEIERGGAWAKAISSLTTRASERIEPKLRMVTPDVSQAMRRGREGSDRVDPDQLLAALNGVYLLCTVRDSRDSLALNALFEQTWQQVGEALEVHINRNLDALKANPGDKFSATRLETGIKMAELRFNPEYAEVLRRARDQARRAS